MISLIYDFNFIEAGKPQETKGRITWYFYHSSNLNKSLVGVSYASEYNEVWISISN